MRELVSPHYNARGFFVNVDHLAAVGCHKSLGFPWKFSRSPAAVRRPAPSLGADSFDVMNRLLGVTRGEYEHLVDRNVTGTMPLAAKIEVRS
jgi:crotonobetainyl-CoA:carnitine CoA-transferase CaiB-like acyl-CoA transferase